MLREVSVSPASASWQMKDLGSEAHRALHFVVPCICLLHSSALWGKADWASPTSISQAFCIWRSFLTSKSSSFSWAEPSFLFLKLTFLTAKWNNDPCPTFLAGVCENESRSVVSDSLQPQGLVHGILQARILEWVAFPFSRGSSQPRDWTQVSCIAGGFFTSCPRGKPRGSMDEDKIGWAKGKAWGQWEAASPVGSGGRDSTENTEVVWDMVAVGRRGRPLQRGGRKPPRPTPTQTSSEGKSLPPSRPPFPYL